MTKVLFLVPYPVEESPSQRFRFEQYFDVMTEAGIEFRIQSFLTKKNWKIFYSNGQLLAKLLTLCSGYLRRFLILFSVPEFDFIFIHRELTPIGPPVFEWLIANVFRKRIIYDFDDAIWLTDRKREGIFIRILKWRRKVGRICRWSYKVSCGNEYLCEFARAHSINVYLNPTTVDTSNVHNSEKFIKTAKAELIIGWTGSHSTVKYLKEIERELQIIQTKYPQVHMWVIADVEPDLSLPRLVFKKWTIASEINDLCQIDIGIMPLPDDIWAKGKCGFKILQYMALGIPSIASPVGVNSTIIDNSVDGFLASSREDWIKYLGLLIENPEQREKIGASGKNKVKLHYSTGSNSSSFLAFFEKL